MQIKFMERCIPQDKRVAQLQARKEERINTIFEKHTKTMTYEQWILHERQKHAQPEGDVESQSPPALESLPSAPKEAEVWATDCAVCLTEFENSEQVCELPCDHIFHDHCIRDWFMKAKSPACPLCRNVLHSGLSLPEIGSSNFPSTGAEITPAAPVDPSASAGFPLPLPNTTTQAATPIAVQTTDISL